MLKDEEPPFGVYKNTISGNVEWFKEEPGNEWIKIGTYRRAFVGDMQKELNECFKVDLMEKFAKQAPVITSRITVERIKYVYIKKNIFIQFYEFIKRLRGKKVEEDDLIEELFENSNHHFCNENNW